MNVLPLHCKRLDHRVARMTSENGGPVSSTSRKNSVPNWYLRAKYTDIQSDYFLARKNILLIGIDQSSSVIRIPPKNFTCQS